MEQSFREWLENLGIKHGVSGYLPEIQFYNPTTKKHGWADFVFPRLKLIIELDGSHHKNRRDLDHIRDVYLSNRGWSVLRIQHTEYRKKSRIGEVLVLLQPIISKRLLEESNLGPSFPS